MVKTWKVLMDCGEAVVVDNESFLKMRKSMATRGGNFPAYQTDDGFLIFYGHISLIKVDEVTPDPIEVEPVEEVEVEEVKDPLAGTSPDEKLALMMKLSSCTHEAEELYKMDTKTGLKYFNICTTCGRRGRFVKAESLGDFEKTQAKQWADKD